MGGGNVTEDVNESYEFTWVGKQEARREAAKPITKTLRPCIEESVDWDTTKNLYIEGDNLEVLKLLQNSYMGKVKMIYIDPPYNTGNDFIYHDDFTQDRSEYDLDAGNVDEDGNRFRKNTETNGRFHSDWCSMIFARFILARNLLAQDGAIFISIDDNEVHNLKKICDEIFGEQNFIAELNWQKKTGSSDAKLIATITEYILVYAKDIKYVTFSRNTEAHDISRYRFTDQYVKERGPYYLDSLDRGTLGYHESLDYPILSDSGVAVFPNGRSEQKNDGWRWKWGKDKVLWGLKNGFIEVKRTDTKDSGWGVYYKIYLNVDNDGKKIQRSAPYKNLILGVLNTSASAEAKQLFNTTTIFSNPKPVELLSKLIQMANTENRIVLDFFSGSATTAHAIFKLNQLTSTKRQFILIQLPEICEDKSDAFKAGYGNICDIGKERIRRAGQMIKNEKGLIADNLDIGFRVFKCDESNMKDVYFEPKDLQQQDLINFMDNIKEDRTDLDLLFDCMLKWGVQLSEPIEKKSVGESTIYNVNDGDLVACFSEKVTREVIDQIADLEPLRVVFRDGSFQDVSEKMNLFEIFKQKCNWSDDEVRKNVRVI